MSGDTTDFEDYLDLLQAFLIANVNTTGIGQGLALKWLIGDPGMASSDDLPVGFIVPLWENVKAYSGLDMATWAVPLLLIDDLHRYGPAVANSNVPGGFEQPGYRVLMQYGQLVRQVLRAGGAGITLEGNIATSIIPSIVFVWVKIGDKPYRGVRLAVTAQTRRARASL